MNQRRDIPGAGEQAAKLFHRLAEQLASRRA